MSLLEENGKKEKRRERNALRNPTIHSSSLFLSCPFTSVCFARLLVLISKFVDGGKQEEKKA